MENLQLDKRPPIAVVTIHRPNVLNALDAATVEEIDQVFHALAADPAVRVILVTGSGDRAFAAGADIRELAALPPDQAESFSRRGQAVLRFIETCGKPVIACVHGFALGGGCELALACTFRLAAEDARLGLPEVKLGVIAGYGGTQRLSRLIGRSAALRLLLTGAMVDAREARRIGLVDEVFPAAELMPHAEALAREISVNAPLAVAASLRAVDEGLDLHLDRALEREAALFGELCATEDKAEGTASFLSKRIPAWQGR
ncbi:MAG: enoyl-CoA hydratase-related protein [Terracidiphilus sp.]|nr:enoyl-CoA hydratase-related protein [Terracidiphilus sp.]